jgi:hypothetical protein
MRQRQCLLKRGAVVQVDVNYRGTGRPEWMVGTLLGTAQYARVCRVRLDDKGDGPWAGQTNVFAAYRVKDARASR